MSQQAPSPKKQILFVCTGNTCRSPMAQGIFQKLLEEEGLAEQFCTRSAGVAAFPGDSANPHTYEFLKEIGIDFSDFRSTATSPHLLRESHLILGMTESHLFALQDLAPEEDEKLLLVTNYNPDGSESDHPAQISDPIGQGPAAYQRTAEALTEHLSGLIEHLKQSL